MVELGSSYKKGILHYGPAPLEGTKIHESKKKKSRSAAVFIIYINDVIRAR